ncbi:hypothetical protein DUNSADRAFT_18411 [Dunaliella salina]|uniref:Uncharacterized protein n=1 Tax=Dunaliella salina TaxID=3046 RepID=A0ABQ7GZ25_DUNSA|nr:hypothetical protein DUNSADRAFT_18411 [Dunaliella salina]|eukprot:KAF5839868.1 hypothetical protein DUNSADRAFT_18411 [Dunaliella salina]
MSSSYDPILQPGAVSMESKADYMKNRQHNYDSKAKSLLYGGGPPATPQHHGRKGVPHAGANSTTAPFATYDPATINDVSIQGGQLTRQYQPKTGQKEGAGKVSEAAFDPEVYRQAIAANASNRQAQRARAWGNGNITGFKDQQQQLEEREQEMRQLQERHQYDQPGGVLPPF